MTGVATAIGASAIISAGATYFSGKAASEAQSDAANAARAEQEKQYASMQQMLGPYMEAGKAALGQQQALSGASGPEAQRAAIDSIQNSPQFAAMTAQGERGILQNASATGGLRGGNTQAALAQYRPQMLNQAINQQMSQLGGIAGMGYNAAGQLGQAGFGGLQYITEAGQAQAGGALATGQAIANLGSGLGGAVGQGVMYHNMMNQQVTPGLANAYNNMTPAQRGRF